MMSKMIPTYDLKVDSSVWSQDLRHVWFERLVIVLEQSEQEKLLPARERLPHDFVDTECSTASSARVVSRDTEYLQIRKARGGQKTMLWRLDDLAATLGRWCTRPMISQVSVVGRAMGLSLDECCKVQVGMTQYLMFGLFECWGDWYLYKEENMA